MRPGRLGLHALALSFFLSAAFHGSVLNVAQAEQSPKIPRKHIASFSVRGLCLVGALLSLGGQEGVPLEV